MLHNSLTLSPRFVEEVAPYAQRACVSSLPSDRRPYELCFVRLFTFLPAQLLSRGATSKTNGQNIARTNDKNQQVKLKKVIQNAY
jgi:hypothetical protein